MSDENNNVLLAQLSGDVRESKAEVKGLSEVMTVKFDALTDTLDMKWQAVKDETERLDLEIKHNRASIKQLDTAMVAALDKKMDKADQRITLIVYIVLGFLGMIIVGFGKDVMESVRPKPQAVVQHGQTNIVQQPQSAPAPVNVTR